MEERRPSAYRLGGRRDDGGRAFRVRRVVLFKMFKPHTAGEKI